MTGRQSWQIRRAAHRHDSAARPETLGPLRTPTVLGRLPNRSGELRRALESGELHQKMKCRQSRQVGRAANRHDSTAWHLMLGPLRTLA
eukprot:7802404-Alexandrium_andersonii.AAC.1